MTYPTGNIPLSEWSPFPVSTQALSGLRIVLPAPPGIYGTPGSQIAVVSNHQPTLAHIGEMGGTAAVALDGGGFPTKVAAALRQLSIDDLDRLLDGQREMKAMRVTLLIPHTLAAAWQWKTGDIHMGCSIQVVSDSLSADDNWAGRAAPQLAVRLLAALRLALGQILLVAVPVIVISPVALAWVAPLLLVIAVLLALVWIVLPGNGWVKGSVLGVLGGLAAFALTALHIVPILSVWSPFLPLGIFVASVWMGGILQGARSA